MPPSANPTQCRGITAKGQPCASPIVHDGWCAMHNPDNAEYVRAITAAGGEANRQRNLGQGFTPDDLDPLVTLEDAKAALDQIRVAVMTRRLTHHEGSAASRAVAEWVKAETATMTARLVNELRAELDAKAAEIAELRALLAGNGRPVRAVS
jgi:hypothetical protein